VKRENNECRTRALARLETEPLSPRWLLHLQTADILSVHPFGSSAAVRHATARGFAPPLFNGIAFVEDEEATCKGERLAGLKFVLARKT
jgi:hypothetical protein